MIVTKLTVVVVLVVLLIMALDIRRLRKSHNKLNKHVVDTQKQFLQALEEIDKLIIDIASRVPK